MCAAVTHALVRITGNGVIMLFFSYYLTFFDSITTILRGAYVTTIAVALPSHCLAFLIISA